jgi:DNA-binding LacI/PurR family transcriptional regulator
MKSQIQTESPTPIRLQLSHILRREIGNGNYATGARIPSERDLAERYGISRASVRESITELIEAGILFRTVGKGTFVADRLPEPQAPKSLNRDGICFAISRDVFQFVQTGYDRILAGVESACRAAGVPLYFQSVPAGAESIEGDWRRGDSAPAGCVVAGGISRNVLDWFRKASVPYVLVDLLVTEPDPSHLAVRIDYAAGTCAAMDHLHALGHRRIGFIGFAGSERYKTYWKTLQHHNLGYDPRHVSFLSPVDLQPGMYAGFRAMKDMLAEGELPTALIVVNDFVAAGVLEQLKMAGIRVPADISIVGFDDLNYKIDPPLTTVRVDLHRVGSLATNALLAALRNQPLTADHIVVPVELIVRASTAPPSAA